MSLKQFFAEKVKPALGCTEPVAVALAVARAREELVRAGGAPEGVEVFLSSNVYKNGATVGIPGTNGLQGNGIAAALALLSGRSEWGLEVLKGYGLEDAAAAKALLESGKVVISMDRKARGVYVRASIGGTTANFLGLQAHR